MPKKESHRKFQLTINNPIEHGFTHEKIKEILKSKNVKYFCLCDETGEQGTFHTHVFVAFENSMMFDTIKKLFPEAHIEKANGTSEENLNYIRKEGKWHDSEKKETNHIESFEEYGELPLDTKALKNKSLSAEVVKMIKEGFTTKEIIEAHPTCFSKINQIAQCRQLFVDDKYSKEWRNLYVEYIYGETGVGKTRTTLDKYGSYNFYRVTDYNHPFDGYNSEGVLILDEFRSSIPFGEMLNLLDGYRLQLPCRYTNRWACFSTVVIISNIPLEKQYTNIQCEQPASWRAFLRRIHNVSRYEQNPFTGETEIITEEQNHNS